MYFMNNTESMIYNWGLKREYIATINSADGLPEHSRKFGGGASSDTPSYYQYGDPYTYDYSGYTFLESNSNQATWAPGGYGNLTSGMLTEIQQNTDTGYKPFGALGQGSLTNLSVTLHPGANTRIMIVTIFPKIGIDNSAYTQTLTVGSFPFRYIAEFQTPSIPPRPNDIGAQFMSVSVCLSMVTLMVN